MSISSKTTTGNIKRFRSEAVDLSQRARDWEGVCY